MSSKYTSLNKNGLQDIQDIIAYKGKIVTAEDIFESLKKRYTKNTLKKKIFELKEKGWLVPLKKGTYFISDIVSHGFVDINPVVIAKALNNDSYISLESAFSHYNFFEQMLKTTTSITITKTKKFNFQDNIFLFLKIKKDLFFGFKTILVDGYPANIADLEKVILDYLYFKSDTYSIDLLIEKMESIRDSIDLKKIVNYAKIYPAAVKRKLGFILDLFGLDTTDLYKLAAKTGYSKLTVKSNIFNAKWRIYSENRFNKQGKA